MLNRIAPLLSLLMILTSCAATKEPNAAQRARLNELRSAMTGTYDSSAQAEIDPEYYNIALHMEPIWTDTAGHYLYVEQALASTPLEPYRQRVYKLEAKGKRVISRVFELREPGRYVGAHKNPGRFATLAPDDLMEKEGCAVYLKRDKNGVYRGSTRKKECKSTLRGAAYATSRVSIDPTFVQSWDRGFNTDDEQVWGATKGGYLFFKKAE